MRVLLQKVSQGQVVVDNQVVGSVGLGFVALVGVTHTDTTQEAEVLSGKIAHLRVFEDDQHKLNLSALDVGGGVLAISQFTLYADARRGRRPDFIHAARPEVAEPLFNHFVACLKRDGITRVETGIFGAMMQVSLVNEGPVTIWLDSTELARK